MKQNCFIFIDKINNNKNKRIIFHEIIFVLANKATNNSFLN